mgnify:FL=1
MTIVDETILVEVAFALPDKQMIVPVKVKKGASMMAAVEQSNIVEHFPEIDLANIKMGLFGKAVRSTDQELLPGDRVEIYRPLLIDPKEARKNRAAKVKADKAKLDQQK